MKEDTNADNFIVHRGGWNCGHELIPVSDLSVPKEVRDKIANKNILEKVNKAMQPNEKELFVAFEPVSATIIQKLSKLKDEKNKQKLLQEVISDERFKQLDLGLQTEAITTIFPGSKISSNRKDTLEIAKNLNNRGISVHFLPESDELKSADAIVNYKGKLIVADLKYSKSTKTGTVKNDIKDGFEKSQMVILKARQADTGQIIDTVDELARKHKITGDLMLVNRLGREKLIKKERLLNGKYVNDIRGFL
jgi:hypothetical protein